MREFKILHPQNGIFIECLQIAGFIEFHQFGYHRLLLGSLGNSFRLLQPVDNLFKCLSIQAPHFPYFLLNLAILFHQTAIQTIGNGSFILRISSRHYRNLRPPAASRHRNNCMRKSKPNLHRQLGSPVWASPWGRK